MKKRMYKDNSLNAYEKELEQQLGKNYKNTSQKHKVQLANAAHFTLEKIKKNKSISIRLSESLLIRLKQKALEEGLSYQTLIGSILHKFAFGNL